MYSYIFPKTDNKDIRGAIVGGVGQVVDAYNPIPASQDTTMNSTAPPPAVDPPPVSPGSSPDSKSPPAFRPKGRPNLPAVGPPKPQAVKGSVKSTATNPKPPPKQGN